MESSIRADGKERRRDGEEGERRVWMKDTEEGGKRRCVVYRDSEGVKERMRRRWGDGVIK